ncbi:acyltransferase family protein [Longitalea arenae]|uniref:acyltransferase family protein n=1 Tax=Longitalea arenae TaxID=2812558 RepID=UPI0019670E92|nr:acyltransferase [Longitalea arenae]
MKHNNNFDVIRLVAALFVITSHAFWMTGKHTMEPLMVFSNNTTTISTIGLYMFFFTSGYLVTVSALASDNARHFLVKRFLRIYPALIVVVLISVFIAGPLLTRLSTADYFQHPRTWAYLLNMAGIRKYFHLPGVFKGPQFYTDDFNGPLWTIGLELKLYISLAILVAFGWIHNKKLHLLICTSLITAALGIYIVRDYGFVPVRYIGQKDFLLMVSFYLGSMIVVGKPSITFLKIAAAAAGIFLLLRLRGVLPNILVDEIVFYSLATYFLAFTKKFRVHIRNDISYGMYLVSMPVQQVCYILSGYNTNPWFNIAVCLLPTIILAWLSWKYIEQPCLQLKHLYRGHTSLARQAV